MLNRQLKRSFDLCFAVMALILFLPLFIIITACSLAVFKGKAFFIQDRIGKGHKTFKILKFRTMNDSKDEAGILLSDKDRLNFYGSFLRQFSLDEIPQLFNIIAGDMSVVGPRPLLPEYLNYFTQQEIIRHSVKPGLTGLAQVKGRNAIGWDQRLMFDIYYVRNASFFLDIKIILETMLQLRKGQKNHFSTSLTEERKIYGMAS
jgi:undecaprenyl phosphate N,N'-diacetylbacillosamine 1-phosphate transferase